MIFRPAPKIKFYKSLDGNLFSKIYQTLRNNRSIERNIPTMPTKPSLLATVALAVLLVFTAAPAYATITLFWEDFDGYTYFPDEHPKYDYNNAGIPKISEGADEIWYGGRFEAYDDGTINQDLAVQQYGGYPNYTPVGRVEDEAGLLFNISTIGLTDVKLSFDYRTFHTDRGDKLVAGFFVGDLDFGTCLGEGKPGCFRDFLNEDFGGDHNAAVQWWEDEWVEIVRGKGSWKSITDYALPEGEENIWVAFWLDDGEKDFGKIDNIHVYATVIPEPISSVLYLLGGGALAALRKRKKRA